MPLIANALSSTLLGLGLALLTLLLLRRSWRYQRKVKRANRGRMTSSAGTSKQQDGFEDAPREVLRWQVAMHETARDLKAELDSKMGAVQVLIGMARQESERLEAIVRRAEGLGLTGNSSAPGGPSLPPQEQRARIDALADASCTPTEIAAQLGLAVDQVELLLSQRPQAE